MSDNYDIEINVDDLMARLREGDQDSPQLRLKDGSAGPRVDWKPPVIEKAPGPLIQSLPNLHGEAFVRSAYLEILGREPDAEGLAFYTQRLELGNLSKIEIIGRLRYSAEGRKQAVTVPGLLPRFLMRSAIRVPYIGFLVALPFNLFRIPRLIRNLQSLEQAVARSGSELEKRLQQAFATVDARLATLKEIQHNTDKRIDDVIANLNNLNEATSAITELRHNVNDHGTHLGSNSERIETIEAELSRVTKSLSGVEGRLKIELRKLASVSPEPTQKVKEQVSAAPSRISPVRTDLDSFYVSLEDKFRGNREVVSERLKVYQDVIDEVKNHQPWQGALDIGCGRGEWLELLVGQDLEVMGVDLNEIMVAECQERGLSALHQDAIHYLADQETGSLTLITGFHVLEHIPFPDCIELLRQCYRVLANDGVLILETPNPENLDVGAHNFYYDPTHMNPIPPELGKFLVSTGGFVDVDIRRVNEIANPFQSTSNDQLALLSGFLADRFAVAPDYAVIARK
ncbi:MAG: methyltransferase domain-containing protein [Pseudomonadales bacterium]